MTVTADSREKKTYRNASQAALVVQQPIRFRSLIRICAMFVAGVGLVALLGWALELPVLASLGSGMIPVAPSTAVMFALYAGAIYLHARIPESRVSYWTGVSINAAGEK